MRVDGKFLVQRLAAEIKPLRSAILYAEREARSAGAQRQKDKQLSYVEAIGHLIDIGRAELHERREAKAGR